MSTARTFAAGQLEGDDRFLPLDLLIAVLDVRAPCTLASPVVVYAVVHVRGWPQSDRTVIKRVVSTVDLRHTRCAYLAVKVARARGISEKTSSVTLPEQEQNGAKHGPRLPRNECVQKAA